MPPGQGHEKFICQTPMSPLDLVVPMTSGMAGRVPQEEDEWSHPAQDQPGIRRSTSIIDRKGGSGNDQGDEDLA